MTDDGTKYDEGKVKWSLLPYAQLELVARVFEHGAEKYGQDNWKGGMRYQRLWDATMRHMTAFKMGEDYDQSGHHHLAHAITSLLMLLNYHCERRGIDDRIKSEEKGVAAVGERGSRD